MLLGSVATALYSARQAKQLDPMSGHIDRQTFLVQFHFYMTSYRH